MSTPNILAREVVSRLLQRLSIHEFTVSLPVDPPRYRVEAKSTGQQDNDGRPLYWLLVYDAEGNMVVRSPACPHDKLMSDARSILINQMLDTQHKMEAQIVQMIARLERHMQIELAVRDWDQEVARLERLAKDLTPAQRAAFNTRMEDTK